MNSSESFLLDQLTVALILLDPQQLIQKVNIATESILGFSSRQLIGTPINKWIKDAEFVKKNLLDKLFKIQEKKYHHKNLYLELCSGKSICVDVFIKQFDKDNQPCLLIELWPVSVNPRIIVDEKELDQHRQTHQLLSNLAHEIRNPLGGLKGAAQLLAKQIGEEQQVFTDLIIREANRMNQLIERVLGPGKAENNVEFNVHQVLEEVVELNLMDIPHFIQIKKDYDPSLPNILGLKSSLFQAVLNLFRNSVQALSSQDVSDEQRIIILSTRAEYGIVIGDKFHRLAIKIDIMDNGPGIPEHLHNTLFLPMVSGKVGGTGLGLSLARVFIEKQGGIIQWGRERDKTRFSIYLPVLSPALSHSSHKEA
ncbi:MAG: hypothetical protein COW84_04255 [Gammaproteobacteria bacterium CG22_combo_CG10-13_8_21_14_all_40_8]|nr:MAG: hypothetical protein COW84_04255 [Gammaproteobacteria bacterium CG22_combo_CG10-13_8_21_14_all_40_8]